MSNDFKVEDVYSSVVWTLNRMSSNVATKDPWEANRSYIYTPRPLPAVICQIPTWQLRIDRLFSNNENESTQAVATLAD